jgi:hypothetical protein
VRRGAGSKQQVSNTADFGVFISPVVYLVVDNKNEAQGNIMNRILAALILSTAAIGAAQAGEIGYLDNPGAQAQSSLTRAQVQNELNANRAEVQAFQGQLDPSVADSQPSVLSRAQVEQQVNLAKVNSPAGAAFVNG